MPTNQHNVNHYHVLCLPDPSSTSINVTEEEIKAAYRCALLRHHPDKHLVPSHTNIAAPQYTVDQVKEAYHILVDSKSRSDYDSYLKHTQLSKQPLLETLHLSLEAVDLDDMPFDEKSQLWYRSCRCGDLKGFVISEDALEKNDRHGEVIAECRSCSLRILVHFAQEDADPIRNENEIFGGSMGTANMPC